MGESVEAAITPDLVVWALEFAGFMREQVAARLDVDRDTLRDWERGESRPTVSRMRKIAALYRRPLALFYLPERPTDFQPTHASHKPRRFARPAVHGSPRTSERSARP